ncbi:MAG: hypothetical protein O3B13_09915 [Planctomycetota bacterium]|nr:hypothetical protein [Planctomycetota bacterium]MDA1163406.1 hypothetical protein [Planctomycetota bacterium]
MSAQTNEFVRESALDTRPQLSYPVKEKGVNDSLSTFYMNYDMA